MSPNNKPFPQDGQKNEYKIYCKNCKCTVLSTDVGVAVTLSEQLPLMETSPNEQTELVTKFFQVDDIYSFENMGFSRTVGNKKYLACAECEMGPLGFHEIDSKRSFLAVDRISYAESKLNNPE